MKVTLSAAMRARDVSRPRPEDEEAAQEAAQQAPTGNGRARAERPEPGGRPAASKNRSSRRKRR